MIRRRKKFLVNITYAASIALVVVVLGVIIWSSIPKLTEGVVVDKTFDPAYDRVWTTTSGSGDSRHTNIHSSHRSASWSIQVSGTTEDGEAHAEWWEIGEALYSRIEIGDWVMRDPETGVIERR